MMGTRPFLSEPRRTLLERLHADTLGTRTTIHQGRYVTLDDADFLSNFMVTDMPAAGWFLKL